MALSNSLLLLPLLIVDRPPLGQAAYSNRLLLALLAALFSLQIFPMAGEQVDWAGLLPITGAAVLVGDGIDCLEHECAAFLLPAAIPRLARISAALIAVLLFAYCAEDAALTSRQWARNRPLDFRGAHWLRLPPESTAGLQASVAAIRRNCQAVLTIPRMPSFSLWSGVPLVEARRITSGPDDIRETELRDAQQRPFGCVLVSRNMYQFWRDMTAFGVGKSLLPEIKQTMAPVFTVGDLTLYRAAEPSAGLDRQPTSSE